MKKNKYHLETEVEFENLESGCISILDIFRKSVILQEYTVTLRDERTGQIKTPLILTLPTGLQQIHSFSDHLPRITPPKDWKEDGTFEDKILSKTIKMGFAEPKYDKKTISAINITQQKKFRINEEFLELLQVLDLLPLSETKELDLPFPTQSVLNNQKDLINSLEKSLDIPHYKKEIIHRITTKELEIQSFLGVSMNYSSIWGKVFKSLPELEKVKFFKLRKEKEILVTMKMKKQIFNTMIQCAKIFQGFPLYFDTYTDYRGRLYPGLYLFNKL